MRWSTQALLKPALTYRTVGTERLNRHGKRLVKNVHNENLHGLYMATLGIFAYEQRPQEDGMQIQSYYGLGEPVEVMDIADNERFDAILGMDVLGGFDFSFSKAGTFELILRH